ncbi:MAG TPA: TIR domain-containing protein [Sphingomicrobium sp.]|nr:TIR domain-containing protein [Sphingomicrobium sp.]
MSVTDIFLSYARHDRASARIFAECLGEEGFRVWWDASLHSGETFDEVIEQRLRDAKAVVVLWSPRSVASRWVRAEATLADRRNKLVPAIIEPCDRPIVFELTHTAELSEWHGDRSDPRWRTFVEDLNRLVQVAPEQAAPEAQAPHKPAPAPPVSQAPAGRQPLRPGSDEVISPDRFRRAEPVQQQSSHHTPAEEQLPPSEVHCLEIEEGDLPEELLIIDSSSLKIGRTAPADIVISHRSVSREHCIIGLANDELLVGDLNSTNGTYVDGVRITKATILPVGSVLRLGEISMRHSVHTPADAERRRGQGGFHSQRVAATS